MTVRFLPRGVGAGGLAPGSLLSPLPLLVSLEKLPLLPSLDGMPLFKGGGAIGAGIGAAALRTVVRAVDFPAANEGVDPGAIVGAFVVVREPLVFSITAVVTLVARPDEENVAAEVLAGEDGRLVWGFLRSVTRGTLDGAGVKILARSVAGSARTTRIRFIGLSRAVEFSFSRPIRWLKSFS